MSFDFEKNIRIDEDALDLEWLDQPKHFIQIAKEAADAQFELDQAKARYDVLCAELDMKIRNNPAAFKIEKITEGAVAAALRLTDEHKDALLELNEAKRDASILQGAVKAFEQRKVALENMVRLHGQSYFAGPKIPRNLSDERQAKEAKAARINEKIKGRIQRKGKEE